MHGKSFSIQHATAFTKLNQIILKSEATGKFKATFFTEVDLTQVEIHRQNYFKLYGVKPSYTAYVVYAVAQAMKKNSDKNYRVFQAWWRPWSSTCVQKFNNVDVAVAIEYELPSGESIAYIDIIRNADRLSVGEISNHLKKLSESSPENNQQLNSFLNVLRYFPARLAYFFMKLSVWLPSLWVQYRGGACMVSAPGKYGVDVISVNWWAPMGFSFGVIKKRPVVRDGQIESALTTILTCNLDVRVMMGAPAARFCSEVARCMEDFSEINEGSHRTARAVG